jgi:hypothetical protein
MTYSFYFYHVFIWWCKIIWLGFHPISIFWSVYWGKSSVFGSLKGEAYWEQGWSSTKSSWGRKGFRKTSWYHVWKRTWDGAHLPPSQVQKVSTFQEHLQSMPSTWALGHLAMEVLRATRRPFLPQHQLWLWVWVHKSAKPVHVLCISSESTSPSFWFSPMSQGTSSGILLPQTPT